jgi:uncharacterized protein
MSKKTAARANITNAQLKAVMGELQNTKQMVMNNSLSGLLGGIGMQSNLTSFNPIVQSNIYSPLTINWMILMYMYKTHGIIQTAIDVPVLDSIRGGLELKSGEISPDELKDLDDTMEEKGVLDTIADAFKWARLFGGAGLVINSDQDPATPLIPEKLKKVEFYAATRWELGSSQRVSDYYDFYGVRLHHSRVITICGKEAPFVLRWQLAGWGMSEVERMVEDFNKYIKGSELLYALLHEAKIDVYRLKGLASQLISATGTNNTKRRIATMNELKSFNSAIVLDMEDEFEQKQLTFSGLADVWKENRISIAAALRMPMTKLFGLSASGFSSGEDDIENYNAMVESEVRNPMKKVIRKVLNLLCTAKHGAELDISFKFQPLRVLSAVEEEQVKSSKHARYTSDYDRGLLDSHEFGQISEKDGLIPIETEASKGTLDPHPEMAQGDEDEEGGKPGEKKKEKKKED